MSRSRFALVLASAALAAGCGGVRPPVAPHDAPLLIRVGVTDAAGTHVLNVPLEDYVLATVLAEFAPPRGAMVRIEQMIEVQSLISRTFVVAHRGRHRAQGFDVCASTHCQLYTQPRAGGVPWAVAAADAVRRTAGTVLWFGDAPVRALYHADCGGHTSAATDVWGGAAPPYLIGRPDGGSAGSAHAKWEFRAERSALQRALNADARTTVGGRFDLVHIVERDSAGRAELVLLQGERQPLVRGEELRAVLGQAFGARSVRSTLFDITRQGEVFVFAGRGFGHGVGLCQAGAFARIRAGATPEEVVGIYFPGTRTIRLAARRSWS